ncbi:HD domain-containing protein [Amycolatopsis aidingensis]|uniref:HD domain-containing protein n=1 Tax=Amycolatopsis aidingensis TaxID=2842453 RepID=UPI001C0B6EFE|nr:HD domain-containing protein [Amycolatopsis aidingensis]
MNEDKPAVLDLPSTGLAARAVELAVAAESAATANHSIRSFLFARLLAEHQGMSAGGDYDPDLLLYACVLHDIGLSERGNRHQRFEVDGADVAAEFLTENGLPAAEVDAVWEAIALHTSVGIAGRRGALCRLTHDGIGMDFGFGVDFVSAADGAAIHRTYPRHAMATTLTEEILAQVPARPEKAPPYSIVADLVRERSQPPHRSGLEREADAGRWGN